MDHLSKQQLILLALLVSFVTSLATGIFTVSLMDQSPDGVIRVVNQIVEKTIEQPQAAAVTVLEPQEYAAKAVGDVSKSIVFIRDQLNKNVSGMGMIVSKQGIILIDKSLVGSPNQYDAVMSDGTSYSVALIQSQINGDIAFLAPVSKPQGVEFVPIRAAKSVVLGEGVLALTGTSTLSLAQGLITRVGIDSKDDGQLAHHTSIQNHGLQLGSPAFNQRGEVIGIKTYRISDNETASFYPISKITTIIPSI